MSTTQQTPWYGWPAFAACTGDPAATLPKATLAAAEERYDVVRIVYRDTACGGERRECVYDHSWLVAKGTEPRLHVGDLSGEDPMTWREVCQIAERLITPLPAQGETEGGA